MSQGPVIYLGEPGHILLDVIPAYVDDGLRGPSHIAVRYTRAGANRDAGIPLLERDLELRNCERVAIVKCTPSLLRSRRRPLLCECNKNDTTGALQQTAMRFRVEQ
jgi:hypothetical protein